MKRTIIALRLMIIGVLCHLTGGIGLWMYQEGLLGFLKNDLEATDFFMLCDNVFKFCLSVSVYALVTEPKSLKLLAFLVSGFILNDLLDELFFDPGVMQWNEMFFSIVLLISTLYLWRKKRT